MKRSTTCPAQAPTLPIACASGLRLRRALLVTGRGGIGKTHEVAAVARELVDERGYVVAIAQPNAEQRLARLGALPAEVANGRRFGSSTICTFAAAVAAAAQLAQAIAGLCERLDADMPARWLLLGTARDDPSARVRLALPAQASDWGPCERVAVPEFDDATLQQALHTLAHSRGVALDEALVPALVANSDRTLRTIGLQRRPCGTAQSCARRRVVASGASGFVARPIRRRCRSAQRCVRCIRRCRSAARGQRAATPRLRRSARRH
jgi:hypothetical protein